MPEDSEMLNFKVRPELRADVDRAAALAGARSRSAWCRKVIAEAAARTIQLAMQREAARQRTLGGGSGLGFVVPVHAAQCQHPMSARWTGVGKDTCMMCGAVIPRTEGSRG